MNPTLRTPGNKIEGLLNCALLLAALLACGSTTMTSSRDVPSREPDCDFEILTALPASGYHEVAVVDVQGKGLTEIADFKEEIQPSVCEAGGDAALALANGNGVYIKATVIVWAKQAPAQPVAAAPAEGCKFDTQCKGDRVCVAGECRDPQPSAAPAATPPPPAAGGVVSPPPAPTVPPGK